ncbi:MAG: bifunctional phosphopantothenoylcysteine decarboxylase/phosphopantothenate--cysteine ligase CoaBC [Rikenellaceae bacterium]|jgi:phosphopantothenoylcysteine decarboxylase/phosphopantothenate--cysteine ligase|nr:bifunctional phosphopantothenoylcysteine decarboxylase/phosphopantothenate--cysteine ligase CoaBC [Rikenellaceae bacterium]
MLQGKKIILGVTGSIAAYKAAMLIRLLVKERAEVRVVMTALAKEFITPLTLATLSKNPIAVEFFNPENGTWNSHVSLGEWADALLIAPATANTIGKMAGGVADNLLVTSFLSAKCPVFVAPAMDLDMYRHPSTRRNLDTLRKWGNHIIEPANGELASGLTGKGRMKEPEAIVAYLTDFFSKKRTLAGKRILVTAGATVEPIDPVRFISNYSTGKMGYTLADTLADRGAEVTLVTGQATAQLKNPSIKVVKALSAREMYAAASGLFPSSDAAVLCAAVADYTPANPADQKIKKSAGEWILELTRTPDIAAELGQQKRPGQILVGFALETNNEKENAHQKLVRKNLDLIVLNSLQNPGAGFGHDTNQIEILDKKGRWTPYPLQSKPQAANNITDRLEELLAEDEA